MESFYAQAFLALQARIIELVPAIKFVDQNIGQYGFDDFRTRVTFPAVLIDFPNTTFSGMQGNIQLGNTTISLSLLFDSYSQTVNGTPDNVKELGLQYLEIEQQLHIAMQGFETDYLCKKVIIPHKNQEKAT